MLVFRGVFLRRGFVWGRVIMLTGHDEVFAMFHEFNFLILPRKKRWLALYHTTRQLHERICNLKLTVQKWKKEAAVSHFGDPFRRFCSIETSVGDFEFLCGRTSHFVVFPPFGIPLKKFASEFEKNMPEDLHGTLGRGHQPTKMGQIHEVQLQDLEYLELNHFGNPRWPACKILTWMLMFFFVFLENGKGFRWNGYTPWNCFNSNC